MAAEVSSSVSSREENLAGRLFERLRGACEREIERAALPARETDSGERLRISLSHRVIGKSEEGDAALVEGGSLSIDVTLFLRAPRRQGAVQPARDLPRSKARPVRHTVGRLAVGAQASGVTMPMVPAELLVSRFGVIAKKLQLHLSIVARFGRELVV